MAKTDARGYHMMPMKYIYLTMFIQFVIFVVLNFFFSGTIGLFLIPMFCLFGGWQMGCLTERIDWQKWYESKNNG